MKKFLDVVLFVGVGFGLAGCCCAPESTHQAYVTYYAPNAPAQVWYAQRTSSDSRFWYRWQHRLFNDGYSFSHDPNDPDSLTTVLGLDTHFPPPQLPYRDTFSK